MLRGKRIVCLLSTSLLFTYPTNIQAPFHNLAEQSIEKQIDNEMVLKTNELGLIENPFITKTKKLKEENDKKKAEEERLRKQKELEEQKKNEIENHKQMFILTYYGATYNECGNNKFITASGVPVREGHIAVPKEIPFGSKIIINGNEYIATDRGNPKYICMLNDGSIRVDIFISRRSGEPTSQYEKRIKQMGTKKVVGELYIKG